jgi:hypothetical protein
MAKNNPENLNVDVEAKNAPREIGTDPWLGDALKKKQEETVEIKEKQEENEKKALAEFWDELDKHYEENPEDPEVVVDTRNENQKDLEKSVGDSQEVASNGEEQEREEGVSDRIEKIKNLDDEVFGDIKPIANAAKKAGKIAAWPVKKVASGTFWGSVGFVSQIIGDLPGVLWDAVKLETNALWDMGKKIITADWFSTEAKDNKVKTFKEIFREFQHKKEGKK